MDQNFLFAVMAAFVIISAIALCIQAGLLFGIYKSAKAIVGPHHVADAADEGLFWARPPTSSGLPDATLHEGHRQLVDLGVKAADIVDSAKLQMVKIDSLVSDSASRIDLLVTDATSRAHNQLEKVELVVDDTVGRVHETVGAVHNGLLAPVRQINGLAAGRAEPRSESS